jgi:hypothetical protein
MVRLRPPILPLCHLDRVVTSRARAPAGLSPLTWGFSPFPCSTTERGEAGEKEGRAATRAALRGRKPSCHGSEHRAGPRHRSRGVAAAGNTYNADVNIYPELATTTSPTRREHPAAIFFSPSSLDASLCCTDDVEARHRESCPAYMLANEPQNCRPATGRSSWALHAPELAVAVRCASVYAGRRAVFVSAGNVVRHRAVSSRAPDFQVAAPGEGGKAARALGTAVACARPCAL